VTGGSAGIGAAIARMLLEEGFQLTIASRRREHLDAAGRALGEIHAVQGDVGREEDCARIVAAHRERFGRLDLLVNSAGVLSAGLIEETPTDEWDRLLAVNTRAAFLMMRLSLPLLRESRGLVVNLASIAGKEGNPTLAAYGASKAALISLTMSFNEEVEADGIRATALCPGFVDTAMGEYSGLPGERMIRPDDCAEVVRMLLRLGPHARVPEVVVERLG